MAALAAILGAVLVNALPVSAQTPAVTVSFESDTYIVEESDDPGTTNVTENSVAVTVRLSSDPQREVIIPIEAANRDGAGAGDYASLPTSVTFNSGETRKTITFTATHDTVDDDGEFVILSFGSGLPSGVTAGATDETWVFIRDDDRPTSLTVSFFRGRSDVTEGGATYITVALSEDPERQITVPITATELGGAETADYSGVPESVTFRRRSYCSEERPDPCYASRVTFPLRAARDSSDDDGEGVRLGFGSPLPAGVTVGKPATATVHIHDGGRVDVGLAQVGIEVNAQVYVLDVYGNFTVEGITNEAWQWQRSATEFGSYSDIPASEGGTSDRYTPAAGDLGMWLKALVTYDQGADTGLTAEGTTRRAVLSQPALSNASYVHYNLLNFQFDAPAGPLYAQGFTTGPHPRGYRLTAARLSLTFDDDIVAGAWAVHPDGGGKPAAEPIKAALPILSADIDDDPKTFEEFTHPVGIHLEPDTRYWIVISRTTPIDDGGIGIAAQDEVSDTLIPVEVTDSDAAMCTRLVTSGGTEMDMGEEPETVQEEYPCVPPVDPGSEDGWSLDFPPLAIHWDDPEFSTDDNPDRALLPWQTFVDALQWGRRAALRMAVVARVDDPAVTVEFGAAEYAVPEGDDPSTTEATENEVAVTVTLSADPERELIIPIERTDLGGVSAADHSTVPSSVTFNSGETLKTITFTATDDTLDDDDEGVRLAFGAMPDERVSTGATDVTTISIVDDDDPEVTVQFGQDSIRLGEGESVNVTIKLSADPEREVIIPVTSTPQGTTSADDYDVPASVTFSDGEIEKTIAFEATQDDLDDDDESVRLTFGTSLPARVTVGTRTETTLSIKDDDDPVVQVQFGASSYAVAESDDPGTPNVTENEVVVTVTLDKDPERTIIIPLTPTPQGTASAADYDVPPSVTFNSGDTSATVTFTASPDVIDDDGEGVTLAFGTMPDPRVSAGTTKETTIAITDDDTAEILLSPASLAVAEEGYAGVDYTVALATEPTVDVTVTIGGHSGTDLTVDGVKLVGDVLTFTPADWDRPQSVTVEAAHDDDGVADNETLTHTAAGAEYDALAKTLPVTVRDNDPLGITVDRVELALDESDSADYTVQLDTEPTVAVTVTISGPAGTDLTVGGPHLAGNALTFTAADWDTPQTVTVTAGHDDDTVNDSDTLTHTGGGGEYEGLEATLRVNVDDNTGDLRLVDGTLTTEDGTPCEGRLEIYYDGKWGTICDDYWTEDDADVACRALGFAGGSVEEWSTFRNSFFPQGSAEQPIILDDLRCGGGEAGLMECPARPAATHNCSHREDVGLRCLKNTGPWIVDVEFGDPPGEDGTYDVGETAAVTLVWSEPVTVSTTPNGFPKLMISYGGVRSEWVRYASGSGSDRTVFTRTLEDEGGDTSFSFIGVVHDSLTLSSPLLSGGSSASIAGAETGDPAVLGHREYWSDGAAATATQGHVVATVGVPFFNGPGEDGVFGAGETVEVTFLFSQAVEVDVSGGTPSVEILLGGTTAREASYRRGSGTAQLVFSYTLASEDGEHTALLIEPDSLALNGGAIADGDGNDADIGHEGAGALFLPAADETAPQLQSATVDGSVLILTFDEELDAGVTLAVSDFTVNVNGEPRSLTAVGVGGDIVLLALSTAVESDDQVTVSYSKPSGANVITDTAGNEAESVTAQAVTNNTASAGTPDPVQAPLSLEVTRHGSGALRATWDAPASGPTPTGYTVQWRESGDDWADEADVSEADVTGTSHVIAGLTDGTEYAVRVIARAVDAASDPSGEVTATPHETVPPAPSSASVDGAALTINFTEALDTAGTPDTSAFAVTVAGSGRGVSAVAVSGSEVTLTLATAAFSGDAVTVGYTAPADESAARLGDLVGNAAATFSGRAVTNSTAPAARLAASVSAVPSSHDGRNTFTFELRFSEEPEDSFTYTTLRDHAFTVTGGTVTKSNRLNPPSSLGWLVHVTPDGNGAVTIVLPATTDCGAQRAICTSDRRPLSERLDITVPSATEPSGWRKHETLIRTSGWVRPSQTVG